MIPPSQESVLYDVTQWTAFRNDVFKHVFPQLISTATMVIFLLLYDIVSHRKNRTFVASLTDIAELSGFDVRTVKSSLVELLEKQLIDYSRHGKDRSRTDKTHWTVPLSEFDWTEGHWTPIPRFLIRRYLPVYPPALLLPVLLQLQQLSWRNECWPSITTLARLVNHSERWVYHALREMGHEQVWKGLRTGLPSPLEISYRTKNGKRLHYFRVRAVFYRDNGPYDSPTVKLAREFSDFFAVASSATPGTGNRQYHA
jgi:hypothetical protein